MEMKLKKHAMSKLRLRRGKLKGRRVG